ncbi:MAG: DNA polymerase II large subunit [Nitrososphaerota archaeon]|jgi:DNA polymerase II large subunit|nr:DNA polymerase II large subunit [Nitrososphaerota archaeon]
MPFSADSAWERTRSLTTFPHHLDEYYVNLLREYEITYNTAEKAKAKGLDPNEFVESKTAFDLADRVNQMLGLTQFEGLDERLRQLLKTTTKERATLTIAEEIALGKFGPMKIENALDYAVRAGLAVITDGVTVAPIQGIYSVSIKKNDDNSEYASISYAGPMRSAGGTEAALSVLIGDVVAKKLGLSPYRAREEEIGRYIEELRVYEREVGNFQYHVTDDDIRVAISNLPVEIDGIETDPVEVVVHRNLKRVSTDRVRGGALRVLNDGIIGRAHKISKVLRELNISGWEWLPQLKGGKQESTNETEKAGAHFEEVISGRAVLSSHNAKGGFRIRYGRAINTGLSTIGIHPAIATLLDDPVVVGTQVKVDTPGKAATIAFVDSLEGPTVLLRDGSVKKIKSVHEAELLHDKVTRILDLGDALISFGDFLENNKNVQPSPYIIEWWKQDFAKALSQSDITDKLESLLGRQRYREIIEGSIPSVHEAFILADLLKIPLHPSYTPHFDNLTQIQILELRSMMKKSGNDIVIDISSNQTEKVLQQLLIPYNRDRNQASIESDNAVVIDRLLRVGQNLPVEMNSGSSLDLIAKISGVTLGTQTTATVGMRVGRPEKAMLRHMKPPVHVLFPVGTAGGSTRDIVTASKKGMLSIDVVNIICPSCGNRRLSSRCQECGEATIRFLSCPRCGQGLKEGTTCPNCKLEGVTHSNYGFDLRLAVDHVHAKVNGLGSRPIKGVRGLSSESKFCEFIEKGALRSKHDIFVYKDGTGRIDLTNAPLTHFRPRDIHVNIEKLKSIGYMVDTDGAVLTSPDQLLELRPQDIVIPENIATDLVRIAKFSDDELESVYGLERIYNINEIADLVGRIAIGLAPHTSVGVVGRIIGFTNAQVCFANPCWHAAKRRDCDGDGDSLLLLLDVLLNFSVEYIPNQIGGLMDTPLLIQPILLPAEVDDQAHNFDITKLYPLEFYEMTRESPNASKASKLIERIGNRLNTENQFYGFGFTNSTDSITIKHSRSAYPTLTSLKDKIAKQIEVAQKVDAVSTKEVVESIIKTHLLRDIMGNTKKYATQSFKCKGCGKSFRRPTISGRCDSCGDELRETLTRASVEKYLALAKRLANDYDVDEYIKNRLDLITQELNQLFQERERTTQLALTDFAQALS